MQSLYAFKIKAVLIKIKFMADPSQPWEKRIMLVHLFDNFIVDMHLNQTEACVMMSSVSLSMTEKCWEEFSLYMLCLWYYWGITTQVSLGKSWFFFLNFNWIPSLLIALYLISLNVHRFKETIKKIKEDGKGTYTKLKVNSFLFKTTQHSTTRNIHVQLLFQCRFWTAFHLMKPNMHQH